MSIEIIYEVMRANTARALKAEREKFQCELRPKKRKYTRMNGDVPPSTGTHYAREKLNRMAKTICLPIRTGL